MGIGWASASEVGLPEPCVGEGVDQPVGVLLAEVALGQDVLGVSLKVAKENLPLMWQGF